MKTKKAAKAKRSDKKGNPVRSFLKLEEALDALCSTQTFKDRYRIVGCCLFQLRENGDLPEDLEGDLDRALYCFKFDTASEERNFNPDTIKRLHSAFIYLYQNIVLRASKEIAFN